MPNASTIYACDTSTFLNLHTKTRYAVQWDDWTWCSARSRTEI